MDDAINSVTALPSGSELMRRWQSLATLEAIMMAEWEYRYFSFNANWGERESMGSMRDGSGSESFFLFCDAGVAGKIYDKERGLMQGEGISAVPKEFSSFVTEPAFSIDRTTCFLWQLKGADWEIVPAETGKMPLLAWLCDDGAFYHAWAKDYYEVEIDLELVRKVWAMEPLPDDLIKSINPERDIFEFRDELTEIGYP